MSHFVVMVTNTNEELVEAQLAPFSEEVEEGDYFAEKEYYLRNDKKEISEWLDNEIKVSKDYLKNPDVPADTKKWWQKNLKDLERIKALKTSKGQLKAIQKLEGGILDKEGLYSLNNPNAKWDWWVEGGRWNNWLIKKNGEKCNRCRIKDIDFDAIRIKEMVDNAKYWIEETERAKVEKRKPLFWGWKKKPTLEQYVESVNCSVAPYAILHEGKWIEKGEMGWWGIDDPHYTEEEWGLKFQEFIKGLDPETEVTIVDCHI